MEEQESAPEDSYSLRALHEVQLPARSFLTMVCGVARFGLSIIQNTYSLLWKRHSIYAIAAGKKSTPLTTIHLPTTDCVFIHTPSLQLPFMRHPRNSRLFASSVVSQLTASLFEGNILSVDGEAHRKLATAAHALLKTLEDRHAVLQKIIYDEIAIWSWGDRTNLSKSVPYLLLDCMIKGLFCVQTEFNLSELHGDIKALFSARSSSSQSNASAARLKEAASRIYLESPDDIKEPLAPLTDDQRITLICTLLIAGMETTSTAIITALYAPSEAIKNLLYSHLDRKDPINCPLMHAYFLEAIRHTCPVQYLQRRTSQTCALISNKTRQVVQILPPSTNIFLSIFSTALDPRLFPNPLHFSPLHFLHPETYKLNPAVTRNFHPFSAGATHCIGRRVAHILFALTLSHLYNGTFSHAVDHTTRPKLDGGLTTTYDPETGPFAKITPL